MNVRKKVMSLPCFLDTKKNKNKKNILVVARITFQLAQEETNLDCLPSR